MLWHYSDNYLSFVPFSCGDAICIIPECLVCGEKLGNNAVVPRTLKKLFITQHPSMACKDITNFHCLILNKKQSKFMTSSV